MANEIYEVKTVSQLFDAMRRFLVGENSTLNNFNAGTRLTALLDAVSQITSSTQRDMYNGLKNSIPIAVYEGFNFSRLPGNNASGKLTFRRSTPAPSDITIPLGTMLVLDGIKFETTVVGVLLQATTSIEINAQASEVGVSGNIANGALNTSLGQGTFVNQPNDVESCDNTSAFAGGTDEESDEARIERFRTFISSLARSTPQGLISGALSVAGIVSASIIENYPSAGWVTIYADDGTGNLSITLKAELLKVINGDPNDSANYPGYRAAGIQVQILPPTIVNVNITLQISILQTSLGDDAELRNIAKTAVEQYVNTLRLGQDVILSEIITAVQNSNTEMYDVSISIPAANVTVPADKIARTGTVSVGSVRVLP